MYHAPCKVESQPFNRSYSQLTFFNFLEKDTYSYMILLSPLVLGETFYYNTYDHDNSEGEWPRTSTAYEYSVHEAAACTNERFRALGTGFWWWWLTRVRTGKGRGLEDVVFPA